MRKTILRHTGTGYTVSFEDSALAQRVKWFMEDIGRGADIVHEVEPLTLNGYTVSAVVEQTVKVLYDKGLKVTAIKLVRDLSGSGLKEAKDFCDELCKD